VISRRPLSRPERSGTNRSSPYCSSNFFKFLPTLDVEDRRSRLYEGFVGCQLWELFGGGTLGAKGRANVEASRPELVSYSSERPRVAPRRRAEGFSGGDPRHVRATLKLLDTAVLRADPRVHRATGPIEMMAYRHGV
jgi:hypothetical protein